MRRPGITHGMVLCHLREFMVERALPGATRRELEARLVPAGLARPAIRHTLQNLARAGWITEVGRHSTGLGRPLVRYAPVEPACAVAAPLCALADALRGWAPAT